jgi:hypothetical protein
MSRFLCSLPVDLGARSVAIHPLDRKLQRSKVRADAVQHELLDVGCRHGGAAGLLLSGGVAVRDNRSTGHVLALLDAIAANVAALRRMLAAREVKMDK